MFCSLCWLFSCQKNPVDNNTTPPPGSTSHGYFYVLNPVSGASYSMGAYDSITWTSSLSSSSYVRVYLYNDQQLAYTYSTYTLNDGVIYWYLPTSLASGNRYHIKIQSATDTSQWDFGGYFTLSSPYSGTYSIQNPVDSSSWTAGNSYTIQWQSTGSPGTYVTLRLYSDSIYYASISTLSSLSAGSYTWTIPGTIASGSTYQIKITSYSDSGLYRFSERFTIAGIDPDAYENDNIRDSAKTAVSGVIQQHTLTYSDTDWVRVAMDSGKTYIIQDSGVSAFYTRLYLYYGTETSYRTYNYSTSTLMWQYACTQTGTYYLKIYPYYSGYTGSYTLRVTEFNPLTSATFSSPISSTTWAAGSSYTISWTPDVGMFSNYVNLYIYKGDQLVYTFTTYASNSGSYTASLPAGLATGSDYRIRIANYSYTQIYGYSQNFTISGMTPDTFEFDNVRDSASPLTLGTVQQHNHTYNDTDWVRFSADSGSRYVVMSTGTSGYRVYAYLYSGSATSYTAYFYSSGSGSILYNSPWTCTSTGTYNVRITPYSSGTTGSYAFKVVKFDSSTAATFSSPTTGAPWSAGSTYSINWSVDTTLFSNYVYLYLYKGTQYLQTIASYLSNTGSYSWAIPAGYATGSDYRIEVVNYSFSSIYAYSQPFSISGVTPDAYEYDDTAGAAKSIATDGTVQNRTLSRSDIDWISFTDEKDSLYVIQASGDAGLYMYEYLYSSPTGSYLTYQYGVTPKIVWTCPQNGTYYVRAYSSSASYYGNYRFSIKKYSSTSIITFINPTASSAWTTGSPYSIQWVVDTALFSASVRLQLAVDTTTILSITASTANTGAYSWTPAAGLATGSQYRIKISNYTYSNIAGYSPAFAISGLDPDAYEPDDSSAIAHTIATSGAAENHTMTISDRDWYKFSATANLLYVIRSNGSIRPALYLYSTDATTLLTSANTAFTDTSASIVWFCPVSGTYYFRATSSLYGSYQTAANAYDSAAYRLTVTAPAAGDTLTTGLSYSIQWSSTVSVGGNVDIFLYDNNGIVGTIVANAANSGAYSWTSGTITSGTAPAGDTYSVRVISRYNSNIFGNSGVFSIK